MRQNGVNADIATWIFVNFLSITIIFFIIDFFMETESVSEVSGPHDMKVIEKKMTISAYQYSYKIQEALKYNNDSCVIRPLISSSTI